MARYRATVDTDRSPEDVFAYLSDFSTTSEWDPGVMAAARVGPKQGDGAEFSLVTRFLGRETQLTYRVIEYDPPRSVTFLGENDSVISRDRITFESTANGTRVSYDAVLTLKGLMRVADPFLAVAFKRVGDHALDGMRRTLSGTRETT